MEGMLSPYSEGMIGVSPRSPFLDLAHTGRWGGHLCSERVAPHCGEPGRHPVHKPQVRPRSDVPDESALTKANYTSIIPAKTSALDDGFTCMRQEACRTHRNLRRVNAWHVVPACLCAQLAERLQPPLGVGAAAEGVCCGLCRHRGLQVPSVP